MQHNFTFTLITLQFWRYLTSSYLQGERPYLSVHPGCNQRYWNLFEACKPQKIWWCYVTSYLL